MDGFTRVNLHCHTNFSDGSLTPQGLADGLAAAGVQYAALTDHDTLEGIPELQAACRKLHISLIPAVEITTWWAETEVHILAYGITPTHPELALTLHSLRQSQDLGIHSVAASIRRKGDGSRLDNASTPAETPNGRLELQKALSLIHRAGGLAFLAHPFALHAESAQLEAAIDQLHAWGLDGLEVYYAAYTLDQQKQLESIANKHNLLMSAGTDAHSSADEFGMDMPTPAWKKFRDAVSQTGMSLDIAQTDSELSQGKEIAAGQVRPRIYRRRYYVLRILLPTLLAISLFVTMIWGMILPSFENSLLDRKRELIRELTNTAHSILASLEQDERAGLLTRAEAQTLAISQIKTLRYGSESKDYFWLQDMHPRIIMHPYRTDLNQQDVSNFTDPRGVRIFVEFADLVRRKGEGYIAYVWQWMDDPQRLEAKESYIKGFEPWGWVIGTGIYLEDVHQEIARIENNLILASGVVSGIVILLLAFVVQQSLRNENQRREIEKSLHDSTERYRSLIEATTEGTLLVLNGRCRYANPRLMRLLNLSIHQLELMDLEDILPRVESNLEAWDYLDHPAASRELLSFQGILQRSDGVLMECVLALNPISSGGLLGYILLAKEIAVRSSLAGSSETLAALAQQAPVGLFRAKAVRRGVFFEANETTLSLLERIGVSRSEQAALADLFQSDAEYDSFFDQALKQNIAFHPLNLQTTEASLITIALSTQLVRDSKGQPVWLDGSIHDITAQQKESATKDALIEKLQTSLLFLQEPVSSVRQQSIFCALETPIHKAAALMSAHNASSILVQSEGGAVIGMVTDHDLRARIISTRLPLDTPVRRIMSAPLVTIHEDALIYEALMVMEEQGMQYLAVENKAGQVVGIIRSKELVQFHRYGSIILTREINQANTAAEIATHHERTPALVQALLESGAKPNNIAYMLSTLCDATTERLINLAVRELGEPPTDFVFIAMGSQGRQEQGLLTDQDNAIIYSQPAHANLQPAIEDYFSKLSARICAGLALAGYSECRGRFMANQPAWRADLDTWQTYYANWIQNAEPEELLKFSIFFDFRPVYGKHELAYALRQFISQSLTQQPDFFPHLAQNSLLFKPPTRLPGKIYLSSGTEHSGQINLKDAMMPVVDFARLYALQHQIPQTNTLSRLNALVERNALSSSSRDEIASAYNFLMKLRLQRQLDAFQNGAPMDNILNPAKISHLEDTLLQQAFAQIHAVQKKIAYDFLGGR